MKKGFSLIELMVVVVIIGILAAIAIPNFIRLKDRAKESEVKANAHTVQLAAEEYSTDNDGLYSGNVALLTLPPNMKNPFTGVTADATQDNDGGASGNEGFVDYDHSEGFTADPYTIYGNGKGGQLVITLTPGM